MSILVIYELLPERVELYLIPEVSDLQLSALKDSNCNFINGEGDWDENTSLKNVCSALDGEDYESDAEWVGIWQQFKVADEKPILDVNITSVFRVGFYL